jgi:hypothetical protein
LRRAPSGPASAGQQENYAELATALAQDGATVWILGGPLEKELAAAIIRHAGDRVRDLTGNDLRDAIIALKAADLAVTNDSGLMHISAAIGTPTVGIFGPTDPRLWGPLNPLAAVVEPERAFTRDRSTSEIPADRVIAIARRQLQSSGRNDDRHAGAAHNVAGCSAPGLQFAASGGRRGSRPDQRTSPVQRADEAVRHFHHAGDQDVLEGRQSGRGRNADAGTVHRQRQEFPHRAEQLRQWRALHRRAQPAGEKGASFAPKEASGIVLMREPKRFREPHRPGPFGFTSPPKKEPSVKDNTRDLNFRIKPGEPEQGKLVFQAPRANYLLAIERKFGNKPANGQPTDFVAVCKISASDTAALTPGPAPAIPGVY